MSKVIYFRNPVQAALFSAELVGQISDGMWENTRPWEHWKVWSEAVVMVDAERPGVTFWSQKNNYNFSSPTLLKYVGDRMLKIANLVENGWDGTIAREFHDYDPECGYQGAYWDRKREHFFALFGSVEHYQAECKGSYDRKKLKQELDDMKGIIRKRVDLK